MNEVRRDNPEANWGNLLTGIVILVLIAVFSIWYFGNPPEDRESLLSDVFKFGEVEEVMETPGTVTVEAEEGLWHVAERVCGDPELYNYVALENDLTVWSYVEVGQELTVTCNY